MAKEVTISNIKKQGISSRSLKRITSFAKSLTPDKSSIKTRESEYPKKGISEVRFEVDEECNNLILAKLLLFFFCIMQDVPVTNYTGRWFTIKSGDYIFSITEEGLSQEIDFNGVTF